MCSYVISFHREKEQSNKVTMWVKFLLFSASVYSGRNSDVPSSSEGLQQSIFLLDLDCLQNSVYDISENDLCPLKYTYL